MPTSIYAHLEFRQPDEPHYRWFASPDFNGQSYLLFALLSGVGAWMVEKQLGVTVKALFEPRGFPADVSYQTRRSERGYELWDEETRRWLSDQNATAWQGVSWLTTSEIEAVLKRYCELYAVPDAPDELRALHAAMKELPEARLVFWFD